MVEGISSDNHVEGIVMDGNRTKHKKRRSGSRNKRNSTSSKSSRRNSRRKSAGGGDDVAVSSVIPFIFVDNDIENDETSSTSSNNNNILQDAAKHCVAGQEYWTKALSISEATNDSNENENENQSNHNTHGVQHPTTTGDSTTRSKRRGAVIEKRETLLWKAIKEYQLALFIVEKATLLAPLQLHNYDGGLLPDDEISTLTGCITSSSDDVFRRHCYPSLVVISQIYYWMGLAFKELLNNDAKQFQNERNAIESFVCCLRIRYHLLDRKENNDQGQDQNIDKNNDDSLLTNFASPITDVQNELTNMWRESSLSLGMSEAESIQKMKQLRIAGRYEERGNELILLAKKKRKKKKKKNRRKSKSSSRGERDDKDDNTNDTDSSSSSSYLKEALIQSKKSLEAFTDNDRNVSTLIKIASCYYQLALRRKGGGDDKHRNNDNNDDDDVEDRFEMALYWYRLALKSFCNTVRFAEVVIPSSSSASSANERMMMDHPLYRRIILRLEEILMIRPRQTKANEYLNSGIRESIFHQHGGELLLQQIRRRSRATKSSDDDDAKRNDDKNHLLSDALDRFRAALTIEESALGNDHVVVKKIKETMIQSVVELDDERDEEHPGRTYQQQSSGEASSNDDKNPASSFLLRPMEFGSSPASSPIIKYSSPSINNGNDMLPFETIPVGYASPSTSTTAAGGSSSRKPLLPISDIIDDFTKTSTNMSVDERFAGIIHVMNHCRYLENELDEADSKIRNLTSKVETHKEKQAELVLERKNNEERMNERFRDRYEELERELEESANVRNELTNRIHSLSSKLDDRIGLYESSETNNRRLQNENDYLKSNVIRRLEDEKTKIHNGYSAQIEALSTRLDDQKFLNESLEEDNQRMQAKNDVLANRCDAANDDIVNIREDWRRRSEEEKIQLQKEHSVQVESLSSTLKDQTRLYEFTKADNERIRERNVFLTDQCEKLRDELSNTMSDSRRLKDEKTTNEEECSMKVASLNRKLEDQRQVLDLCNVEKEKFRDECDTLSQRCTILNDDVRRSKDAITDLNTTISELEEEKKKIQNDHDSLAYQSSRMNEKLRASEDRLLKLQGDIKERDERNAESVGENQILRDRCTRLKDELELSTDQCTSLNDELNDHREKQKQLQRELRDNQEMLKTRDERIDVADHKIIELETDLQQLRNDEKRKEEERNRIVDQKKRIEEENNRSVDRCIRLESDVQKLMDQNADEMKSKKGLIHRVSELQDELADTKLGSDVKIQTLERQLESTIVERDLKSEKLKLLETEKARNARNESDQHILLRYSQDKNEGLVEKCAILERKLLAAANNKATTTNSTQNDNNVSFEIPDDEEVSKVVDNSSETPMTKKLDRSLPNNQSASPNTTTTNPMKSKPMMFVKSKKKKQEENRQVDPSKDKAVGKARVGFLGIKLGMKKNNKVGGRSRDARMEDKCLVPIDEEEARRSNLNDDNVDGKENFDSGKSGAVSSGLRRKYLDEISELKERNQELEVLAEKNNGTETELELVTKRNEKLSSAIKFYQDEVDTFEEVSRTDKKEIKTLSCKLKGLEKEYEDLKEENRRMLSDATQRSKSIAELEGRLEECNEEKIQAKDEIIRAKQDYASLQNKHRAMTEELSELMMKHNERSKSLAELKDRLEECNGDKIQAKDEIIRAKQEYASLQNKHRAMTEELSELMRKHNEQIEQGMELRAKIQDLKDEVLALNQEKDETNLQHSKTVEEYRMIDATLKDEANRQMEQQTNDKIELLNQLQYLKDRCDSLKLSESKQVKTLQEKFDALNEKQKDTITKYDLEIDGITSLHTQALKEVAEANSALKGELENLKRTCKSMKQEHLLEIENAIDVTRVEVLAEQQPLIDTATAKAQSALDEIVYLKEKQKEMKSEAAMEFEIHSQTIDEVTATNEALQKQLYDLQAACESLRIEKQTKIDEANQQQILIDDAVKEDEAAQIQVDALLKEQDAIKKGAEEDIERMTSIHAQVMIEATESKASIQTELKNLQEKCNILREEHEVKIDEAITATRSKTLEEQQILIDDAAKKVEAAQIQVDALLKKQDAIKKEAEEDIERMTSIHAQVMTEATESKASIQTELKDLQEACNILKEEQSAKIDEAIAATKDEVQIKQKVFDQMRTMFKDFKRESREVMALLKPLHSVKLNRAVMLTDSLQKEMSDVQHTCDLLLENEQTEIGDAITDTRALKSPEQNYKFVKNAHVANAMQMRNLDAEQDEQKVLEARFADMEDDNSILVDGISSLEQLQTEIDQATQKLVSRAKEIEFLRVHLLDEVDTTQKLDDQENALVQLSKDEDLLLEKLQADMEQVIQGLQEEISRYKDEISELQNNLSTTKLKLEGQQDAYTKLSQEKESLLAEMQTEKDQVLQVRQEDTFAQLSKEKESSLAETQDQKEQESSNLEQQMGEYRDMIKELQDNLIRTESKLGEQQDEITRLSEENRAQQAKVSAMGEIEAAKVLSLEHLQNEKDQATQAVEGCKEEIKLLKMTLNDTRTNFEDNENKISRLITEKEDLQVSLQELEKNISSKDSNLNQLQLKKEQHMLVLEQEVRVRKEESESLNARLFDNQTKLSEQGAKIHEMEDSCTGKDSFIEKLQKEIGQATQKLVSQSKEINTLRVSLLDEGDNARKLEDQENALVQLSQDKDLLLEKLQADKEQEIEGLEGEIEKYKGEIKELKDSLSENKSKLEDQQDTYAKLSQEKELSLAEMKAQKDQATQSLEEEIDRYKNEISELQDNLSNTNLKLEEQQDTITKLSTEKEQEVSKLEKQMSKFRHEIKELQDNLSRTESKLEEKINEIARLSEENFAQQRKALKIGEDNKAKILSLQYLQTDKDQATQEIEKYREENKLLKEKLNDTKLNLGENEDTISRLIEEKEALQVSLRNLEEINSSKESNMDQLQAAKEQHILQLEEQIKLCNEKNESLSVSLFDDETKLREQEAIMRKMKNNCTEKDTIVGQLQKEMQKLQSEKKDVVEEMENKIKLCNEEIESVKKSLANTEAMLQKKENIIGQLQKEIHRATQELKDKDSSFEQLQADKKKVIQELEDKIKLCSQEIESVTKSLTDTEAMIQRKENIIKKMEDSCAEKDSFVEQLQKEIVQASQQLREKSSSLDDLQADKKKAVQELENKIQLCSEEIESITSSLVNTKAALAEKDKAIRGREHSCAEKDSFNEQLQREIDRTTQELRDKDSSLEQLQVEKEKAIQEQKDKIKCCNKEIESVTRSLEDAKVMIQEKENVIIKMESSCAEKDSLVEQLQKEIDRATQELTEKESSLEQWQIEKERVIQELKDKIKLYSEEIQSMTSSLADTKATLQEKENTIRDMESSCVEKDSLVEKLQKEIDHANYELRDKDSSLDELQAEKTKAVQELEDKIKLCSEEIESVTKSLAGTKATLQEKDSFVKKLQKEIGSATQELRDKDLSFEQLKVDKKKAIQELENKIKICNKEIESVTKSVAETKATLQKKEYVIQEMEDSCAEKDSFIEQLQNEIDQATQELRDKDSSLEKLQADKDKTVQELEDKIKLCSEEIESLTSSLVDTKATLWEKENTIQEIEDNCAEKDSFIEQLQNEIDQATQELEKQSKKIDSLKFSFEQLKSEREQAIREMNGQIEECKERIEFLENNLIVTKNKLEKQESMNEELSESIKKERAEKEAIKQKCLNLEADVNKCKEENKKLASLLKYKTSQIQALSQNIDEADDIRELEVQCAEMEDELIETTELNEELNEEINALREEINRIKSGVFDSEIDHKAQVDELLNEMDQLKKHHDIMAAKLQYPDGVEDGPEWTLVQLKLLEDHLSDVTQENAELENRLEDILDENDLLASRLEEYQNSIDKLKNGRKDVVDLEEELLDTVEMNEELNEQVLSLKQKVEEWKVYAEETEKELETVSDTLLDMEKKNTELLEAINVLEDNLNDATDQNEKVMLQAKNNRDSLAQMLDMESKEQKRLTDLCSTLEFDLRNSNKELEDANNRLETVTLAKNELQQQFEETIEDMFQLKVGTDKMKAEVAVKDELQQLLNDKTIELELSKAETNSLERQIEIEKQVTSAYESENANEFDKLYRDSRQEVQELETKVTDLEENSFILQKQLADALNFKEQQNKIRSNTNTKPKSRSSFLGWLDSMAVVVEGEEDEGEEEDSDGSEHIK